MKTPKHLFLLLGIMLSVPVFAEFDPAVHRDPVRPSTVDTTGSWYKPERIYYNPLGSYKYTGGDFLNALDLPTVFGLGFNPTGNEKGVGYYSQMFLEWRMYKTFGWFAMAGLDSHNQTYEHLLMPADWKPSPLAFVSYPDDMKDAGRADVNIASGTVYNTEILFGVGYRVPLVKDIRAYYEHPYINKLNFAAAVQLGYNFSTLKHVTFDETSSSSDPRYHEWDVNYYHPVMKFNLMLEYLVGPYFAIFVQPTYIQHLTTMPWDNPTTHAGTLAFSIGFTGFFN